MAARRRHDDAQLTVVSDGHTLPPPTRQVALRSTPAGAAAVAVPAAAAAAVVGAVLWIVGVSVPVVIASAAAVAILVALWLRFTAARSALRALRARPAAAGTHVRLENLIEGLCTTHGFREPSVHTVDTAAINAAAVGLGRHRGHLVVTRGALDQLDRLELEAVVSRQLCQMRRVADSATLLASVARLPGAQAMTARLVERVVDRQSTVEIDIEAVQLTSYPPALASALDKAARAPSVDSASAASHLWMLVPPVGRGGDQLQPTAVERLDVLGEV